PEVLHITTLDFANAAAKVDLINNELDVTATVSAVHTLLNANHIVTSAGAPGVLGYGDKGGGVTAVRYTLPGDANLDGSVGVADLGALSTAYGTTGTAIWSQGDFNNDSAVGVADLGALSTNYGNSLVGGPADNAATATA